MDYLTPVIAAGKSSVASGKNVGSADCGVNATGLGRTRAKGSDRASARLGRIGQAAS